MSTVYSSQFAQVVKGMYKNMCFLSSHWVHLPLPSAIAGSREKAWVYYWTRPSMEEGTLKTPIPLMPSSLVILFGVVKQLCRFRIWSETECKTPAEYGPQYISSPPTQSHIVRIYCTLGRGGGGRRSERRYSRGATLNSTQV